MELESYKKGMQDLALMLCRLQYHGLNGLKHGALTVLFAHLSETMNDMDKKKIAENIPDLLQKTNTLVQCPAMRDAMPYNQLLKDFGYDG